MSRTLLSLAGFQVILIGRFWVIAEAEEPEYQKELAKITKRMAADDYFGLCPECHTTDGYINTGRCHWFYCLEHKTCWCVGSNLFSSCKTQTEEEKKAIFDKMGFESFEEVTPYREATPAEQPDITHWSIDEARKMLKLLKSGHHFFGKNNRVVPLGGGEPIQMQDLTPEELFEFWKASFNQKM
jgi:hypothetical protein